MSIHLRQVALVAARLPPVVEDLHAVLGLEVCFVDDAVAEFGLENSLLPVGGNFIEVVAPIAAGTAAERYLERRDGDGGYMVITQADCAATQTACLARAGTMGIRVAWEKTHEHGRYLQLHPQDTGGCFLEIDSTASGDPRGPWPPADGLSGSATPERDLARRILAVELQSPDPRALAERWGRILDLSVHDDGDERCVITLANANIRFCQSSDHRGEGLVALDLEVRDRASVMQAARERDVALDDARIQIGGVIFNLEAS